MEEENLLHNIAEINRLLDDDNISVYSNASTVHDDHNSDSEESLPEDEDEQLFDDNTDTDPHYDPSLSHISDNETESSDSEVANESACGRGRGRGRGRGGRPAVNIAQPSESANYFYGKNRMKWAKLPPAPSRTRSDNIITKLPGLKGNAKITKPKTPLAAWKLLFDDQILDEIIDHTNERITNISIKYGANALNCQFTKHTDKTEFEAFIGLLYLTKTFTKVRPCQFFYV